MAPGGVGGNEYYPTEAAYLDAVADALHAEYATIVEAGFTLQIDDPCGPSSSRWPRAPAGPPPGCGVNTRRR